jgi:hypothetical protein
MVAAREKLFVAGPPDVIPEEDPLAPFEGRLGALLWSFSVDDGEQLAAVTELSAPPVYDGLIASREKLYLSLENGRVVCYGAGPARRAHEGSVD